MDPITTTSQASASSPTIHPGLEGIYFTETRLSHVDGQAGQLVIAGYPVEEIAPKATFEEVAYLLWLGRRPQADELRAFRADLAARSALPEVTVDLLRQAAARELAPMDALRLAIDSLALADDTELAPPSTLGVDGLSLSLLARAPQIVAGYQRLQRGEEPAAPRSDLGLAAGFLAAIDGREPAPERVRALETYLVTVCDHGANASTFAARVIVATRSDLLSAVVGALGALKGPLHGGAPGPALDMVFEIGSEERAEECLRRKLASGERLMGFGHRVYKVRDPRAEVLALAAERLFAGGTADRHLYQLARHVEDTAIRLLDEVKPGRNLRTNVEFYTALLLHGIGLPTDLFTPVFAMARTAGWIAHCREQQAKGRLIRPSSHYVGARDGRWD